MRVIGRQTGFPILLSYDQRVAGSRFDALCMEQLGPTLLDVWERTTMRTHFDGPTIVRHGRGLVQCLRALHGAGFVHNDLKPNNILLGTAGSAASQVHLIDFGLATRFDDGGIRGERGTPNFASLAAHNGEPTRPRDDLESLVYCLAYLASGKLPWTGKPVSRAAFLKRRMLSDGWATPLTDHVPAQSTAKALQALWDEVVLAHHHETRTNDQTVNHVNYDACLLALPLA